MLIICFFLTGSIKWTQRTRNEFDKANRIVTEDDINKLILEAEGKKNNSSIMFTKTARTPQRGKRQYRQQRGGRRKEGNKDWNKI